MPSIRLQLDRDAIAAFCRRHKIRHLALFGSVLRDDFGPDSDVDVLVSFAPESRYSLMDLAAMKDELEVLLGRSVDLVDREAVARSGNYIRRHHILDSAESVYAE